MHTPEQTLSVRLVWPLLRVGGTDPWVIEQLERIGVSLRSLAHTDTRAPHGALMSLLQEAVRRGGDPRIGLNAGGSYQPGDLDALEHVAASAPTLREAIACVGRYISLMHGGLALELEERGDRAIWRFHVTDGVPQLAVANDFTLALAYSFMRVHTGKDEPMLEVHVEHGPVSYAPDYARVFGTGARFDMPQNALVFRREHLATPMLQANAALHTAFEFSARDLLARVAQRSGVRGKVRELVTAQLRSGDTRMSTVAESLAMSVATLRRRLDEEGTSHTEILDEVRHELAKRYLRDPQLAISEIAFMLGFAHVAAFYKAFRRWTNGSTPATFRNRYTAPAAEFQPSRL